MQSFQPGETSGSESRPASHASGLAGLDASGTPGESSGVAAPERPAVPFPAEAGTSPAAAIPVDPAFVASAITRDPPRLPTPRSFGDESPAVAPGTNLHEADPLPVRRAGAGRRNWSGALVPLATFLAMVLLAFYLSPALLYRWRAAEAQADAEAVYQRRPA